MATAKKAQECEESAKIVHEVRQKGKSKKLKERRGASTKKAAKIGRISGDKTKKAARRRPRNPPKKKVVKRPRKAKKA